MDFLTFARDSKLISHELAFKFSAIVGVILFILVLLKTNIRHKQRPFLMLCLCAGYMALQLVLPTEYFPFTAFPSRSYGESLGARYLKVQKVLEGGDVLPLGPHPIFWSFTGGQSKRALTKLFDNPKACRQFMRNYSTYDFGKDPKVGRPVIRELRFESWKWDWIHDSQNPDRGFLTKRMICKA